MPLVSRAPVAANTWRQDFSQNFVLPNGSSVFVFVFAGEREREKRTLDFDLRLLNSNSNHDEDQVPG